MIAPTTTARSRWWDLAIAIVPAVISAGAVLIPWWVNRRQTEGKTDGDETEGDS